MLLTVFHSCLISGLLMVWFWKTKEQPLSRWFFPAIGVKVICGWLVGGMYHYYYAGGDTWNYYSDGVALAEMFSADWRAYILSWVDVSYLPSDLIYQHQPRALLMDRIVSLGCLATGNNYWLISVYFSLFSFSGLWLLGQALYWLFPGTQNAIVLALFVYPSFVFWSSGILKETIAVGLIGLMLTWSLHFYYQNRSWGGKSLSQGIGWMGAAYLLWLIKYYYAAVLVPMSIAIVLAKKIPVAERYHLSKMIALFFLMAITATLLHPNLSLTRIMEVIVDNHEAYIRMSDPSNTIHFWHLKATVGSMLQNVPLAWFSSWYRPILGETNHLLQHLAGVENILLLGAGIASLVKLSSVERINRDQRIWITGCIMYATLLGILLAFSTPNFGTLIRYKVAYVPILVYFSSILIFRKAVSGNHINGNVG